MWPVASSSGCAVTSSSVPMCDIIPVRKNLHVAALHLGLVSANATDWCLTFDQRHRVSTVHLVIARAYFIVVGAWVSGLYYARGYLGGGDTSRRGTPNLLAHPSFSWDCGKRERCEVRGCGRLMPPAAFSPLRRRAFLQARARVEVSWGRTRLPG